MKKSLMGKWSSFALVLAMLVSLLGNVNVSAAKAPKISTKNVTVTVGKTAKVTVKNLPSKAKTTWKTKNAKIATVKNGKIKGIKAGKTKVTAKVVYKKGKKSVKKQFTVGVTVKNAASKTVQPSEASAVSQAPAQTAAQAPAPSNASTQAPSPTDAATQEPAPTKEVTPAPTPTPVVSKAPVQSRTPAPDYSVDDSNLTDEHVSANGITTKDNGLMRRNLTAQDITTVMGLGWNVGNSLEQTLAKSCTSLSEEEQAALTPEQWVKGYETNADNVESTQKLFDGLKQYGINTIRIPVAWSNMMETITYSDGSKYYKINDAYFNRVEEVMNYCLNDEMYVIINIHWDNGWWGMFGDKDENVRAEAWKKYKDMWTQIATRYQEYSDHLIFEGGNEELGERLNDDWTGGSVQTGTLTREETYEIANKINQTFVDTVRDCGINADGTTNNNYDRFLLIPGYDTNLHQTCGDQYSDKVKLNNDKLTYIMPSDPSDNGISKLFVSIHYYDPLGWGIAKSSASSYDTPKGNSKFQDTWGSDEDYAAMQEDFDAVKTAFTDKGYGVIFGEFGVVSVNKDGIPDYFRQFFKSCKEDGMVPVMWDEGTYVDRTGKGNSRRAYFVYDDIGQIFSEITGTTPKIGSDAMKLTTHTGIPASLISENQDPLVVATWDGDFMRNTTTSKSVSLDEIKAMFGAQFIGKYNNSDVGGYFNTAKTTIDPNFSDLTLEASCSKEWWHAHYQLSDWSQIKNPCVRISVHDDDISKSSDLQLVYTDASIMENENGAPWRYEKDLAQVVYDMDENGKPKKDERERAIVKRDENGDMVLADTAWIGKVLSLDKTALENYPVLIITTNNYLGADFVKVEICDAAYNADGTPFESSETK